MYCHENENEKIHTLTYERTTSTLESTQSHSVESQTIAYGGLIAEYTIPINFMVGLLEISASKDFVNSFIDMAKQETNINLRLQDIQNRTEVKTEKKYTREIEVKGVRNYVAEIKKWQTVEGTTEEYRSPGTGVTVSAVQTSVLDSGKTKVSYQLDGLPGVNPDGSTRTLTADAHDKYYVELGVVGLTSILESRLDVERRNRGLVQKPCDGFSRIYSTERGLLEKDVQRCRNDDDEQLRETICTRGSQHKRVVRKH